MKRKKWNKKLVSLLKTTSYSFLFLLWFASFFIDPPIMAENYDKILFKVTNSLLLLSILLPIFILMSKKIKQHLPMFKKKRWWSNVFGSILIFLLFAFLGYYCDTLHSDSFKNNYTEYKENERKNDLARQSIDELENKRDSLSEEIEKGNKNTSSLSENLKIHYLDVGQGDSTLIELPNGETMLIDAAEKSEASKIIQYIKDLGYNKINYIIGTHPHTDHIGGLASIIESFEVGSIYMPKVVATSKTYENLLTTIANQNLKIKTAKKGLNIIDTEKLKIKILSPSKNEYNNLNNYSAVLKLTYQNHQFLFMGDAEKEIEEEIANDVAANVIKVGHHGSNTSSSESFVKQVKPNYAIISVGDNNKYNHPSDEIVNRWLNIGAKIYQTNKEGTIIVTSDGTNLNINTKSGKKEDAKNLPINEENLQNTSIQEKLNGLELINLTSPIKSGGNANLKIKGIPNTEYHISVVYSSKESTANGLENQIADMNGYASWTWKVGTNTKEGTYKVTISGGGYTKQFDLIVE